MAKQAMKREIDGKAAKVAVPAAAPARPATAKRTHRIAVLAGDGIGEEVIREGLKVLDAVAAKEGFALERKVYPYGADHYLATKEAMPATAPIDPIGLATPLPAYFGADPWTGSNIETWPGWMFPEAAMPRPPQIAAPRSVRMSPNRFVVTIVSNCSGFRTSHMQAASTYIASRVTSR